MRHLPLALLGAAMLAAALPGAADASEIVIGQTSSPLVAPSCPAGVSPSNCTIVLPQMTALETSSNGFADPTTVRQAGELVALDLGISSISSNPRTAAADVSYLDSTYGGPPEAAVTVLRPIGKRSRNLWTVAAESQPIELGSHLGQVDEFPLISELPVVPGEVIALTVPTWAPVLSIDLAGDQFAYRQSLNRDCAHTSLESDAQMMIGLSATYGCSYSGTRVEYAAVEITSPSSSSSFALTQFRRLSAAGRPTHAEARADARAAARRGLRRGGARRRAAVRRRAASAAARSRPRLTGGRPAARG
jgi:hypothetical protein